MHDNTSNLKCLIDYLNNKNKNFDREKFLVQATITTIALYNSPLMGAVSTGLAISGDSFEEEIKQIFSYFKKTKSVENMAKIETEKCKFADVALAKLAAMDVLYNSSNLNKVDTYIMRRKIKNNLQEDTLKHIIKLDINREQQFIDIFKNSEEFDYEEYWKQLIKNIGNIIEDNDDEYEEELLNKFKETYGAFKGKLKKESKIYSNYIDNLNYSKTSDIHDRLILENSSIDIFENTDWMINYLNQIERNLYYTEKNIQIFEDVYLGILRVENWKEDIFLKIDTLRKELDILDKVSSYVKVIISFLDDSEDFLNKSIPYIDIQKDLLEKYYECYKKFKFIDLKDKEAEFENEYKLMKIKFNELKNVIKASFRRLIIVEGETGSGKSHLLKSVCKRIYSNIHNKSIYFIPLKINKNDENIESSMLKSLNSNLNLDVKNLNEFNKKLINSNKIKIYFIIDDIHKYIKTPEEINDLFNSIERTTIYSWCYWIMTVHTFKMDILINNKKTISDYCFDFKKDIQNEFQFIDLKKYTQKYSLGEKIIESYGLTVSNVEFDRDKELNYNPLFAHIFATTPINNYKMYKDISYFQFYIKFSEYIIKKIKNSPKLQSQPITSESKIQSDISNFVKYIVEYNKLVYKQQEWDILNRNSDFKRIANNLISTFLIHITEISSDNEYLSKSSYLSNYCFTEKKYTLMYDFFWMFQIILSIASDSLEEKIKKLSKFDDEISIELFLTLFICEDNRPKRNGISMFIEKIKHMNKYRKVLYRGSIYGSIKTRHTTLQYLNKFNDEISDKNELYNLLIFISSLNLYEIQPDAKCKLLAKYYNAALKNDLISYFNVVALEAIDKINDEIQLKKCINHFISCNNKEFINLIPAKICGKILKLFAENNNKEEKIINYFMGIIFNPHYKLIINSIIEDYKLKNEITFIEKLIRCITAKLINEIGIEYNNILINNKKYYDLDNALDTRCNATILMLKKSVTIEFGRYYRKSDKLEFKMQYRKMTNDLINKKNPILKKIAFHFIINTVETDNVEFLDVEFIPQLIKLKEDLTIKEFINERRDIITRVTNRYNNYPSLKS